MNIKTRDEKVALWRHRLLVLAAGLASILVMMIVTNGWIILSGRDHIVENADNLPERDYDAIIVLGARVLEDGSPSQMLEHRLDTGLELYEAGYSDKILVTGNNTEVHFDEVQVMREWYVDHGVPGEAIFEDHAGYSTYESMYRARDIFQIDTAIIATQGYHQSRALYIANGLGIDAWGVPSGGGDYDGQSRRDVREWFARTKDFGIMIYKPDPQVMGPATPISGDGTQTWD